MPSERAAGALTSALPARERPATDLRRAILGCVLALVAVAVGPYVLPPFMVNSLIRAFLYAAAALTVDLLWGYTGILTFGQSAYFGIGAYAMGLTFTHLGFSTLNGVMALAAGLVAAVAVAALVGWLSFYPGASPLCASVVSLVLPIVMAQLIYSGGTFTGSSSGLSGFESFDISVPAWFWIAGGFLALLTAVAWLFVKSDAGRVLVAMRENEQRCEYLGIDISRVKILLLMATGLPPHRVARRAIAYTPQEQSLFQDLTVKENLQLGVADPRRFEESLRRVGRFFPFLPQRLGQQAGTLSGGEQKMLLISRALMARPRLMLIDEISEGLQPSVVERLVEVLKSEREASQVSILLIEQNIAFALAVADRYAVLQLGEIVDRGTVDGADTADRIATRLSV